MTTSGQSVVVITGATGGLGRAMIAAFESSGWNVAATSRNEPLMTSSESVFRLRLNVTESAAASRTVQAVLEKWGRLDVWVNNAGITIDKLLPMCSDEAWDQVTDVNLTGAFRCCRAVLPTMLRQRSGHIINIASYVGQHGAAGQSAYASAKAGLLGLTQSLAAEVGSQNVRVNAILPGVIATAMTQGITCQRLEELKKANVLGRLNEPEEVARAVAFIASLTQVSGQVFQLDSRLTPLF